MCNEEPDYYQNFNPRPRAGGDIRANRGAAAAPQFQSTPPRRGRPAFSRYLCSHSLFQSTPPRRGRPGPASVLLAFSQFQSTPPRRGRPCCIPISAAVSLFQSTPPRRGRHKLGGGAAQASMISIHAPAQGATGCHAALRAAEKDFNPRPRAGGDRRSGWGC